MPASGRALPDVLAHVAAVSVRRREHGWTWAHNPRVVDRPSPTPADLGPTGCPVALVQPGAG